MVFRAQGDYGPINLFGMTLAAMAMLVAGMAFGIDRRRARLLGLLVAAWLLAGALTSLSRAVLVVVGVGLILCWAARAAGGAISSSCCWPRSPTRGFAFSGLGRLFQLSNSSTAERAFYLTGGLHALQRFWLIGAGWGNSYLYDPSSGLYNTGNIPWYHNDYLSLSVQLVCSVWLFTWAFGVESFKRVTPGSRRTAARLFSLCPRWFGRRGGLAHRGAV